MSFGETTQGVVFDHGFFNEHVETTAAALAGSECCCESGFIDDATARTIHNFHTLLHFGEGGCVDHTFGLFS